MGLEKYFEKRNFDNTPEPTGGESRKDGKLIFVVQWHQASSLHYDFRIEAEGVLKSWAVPKGPSMNPKDKRLAVNTEDHPLDYATFEGEIPKGNYGAGTMRIWDSGTWQPLDTFNDISKSLADGTLEFTVNGKYLKGEFALIKMKHSKVKNGWLLIKKGDEFAVNSDYDANTIP